METKALSSRNMRKGRGKELYESEKGGKLGRCRFLEDKIRGKGVKRG